MTTTVPRQRAVCPRPAVIPPTACTGRKRHLSGKSHWLKLLAILCCMVNAVAADTFGFFTYTDDGESITITDYPTTAVGPVDIPASIIGKPVTNIGGWAFYSCRLTSVAIPAGLTSIGKCAFSNCTSLTSITVAGDNPAYSGGLDGALFDKLKTTLIQYPGGKSGAYTIPPSVTSIGEYAFWQCMLTSVTIPSSVTSIGTEAFSSCMLTSVTIPASVTITGDYAFSGCTGLTSATIVSGITSIGNFAFDGCTGLTSVTIPSSVTRIGNGAFNWCIRLATVTIPSSVTSIGYVAFGGNALTSVAIPASVTSIGYAPFFDCTSLTSITVAGDNPAYSAGLDGALFDKLKTTLIQYPGGKSGAYTIPPSVTSIRDSAFASCYALTSVTIPSSVTSIGNSAFWRCTGLTSATIPNSVTSIGDHVFDICTGLTSVTIPNSVTNIGNYAFYDCTSLASVTIPASVTTIGEGAFANCFDLTSVTIPAGVTSIGTYAFYGCTSLTSANFAGNAPVMGSEVFDSAASVFTVHYFAGRTGFTAPTWKGYPAVMDPAPALSVATGGASGITAVSAILQGTVNPHGVTTSAWFEYGLTSTYGSTASVTLAPDNGSDEQTVSAGIGALQTGQTYHYRLVATNFGGTRAGADATFATERVLTIIAQHGTVPGAGQYAPDTTVQLCATPDPGYVFTGWTGDATGTANPLSVLMDADKTITADFAPDTADSDGDGLHNYDEAVIYGTNSTLSDTDGDGLIDGWEVGLGRFSIIAGSFTWAQARADAQTRDGELACFPTADRWSRAMETLGANALDSYTGLWIGASDAATEGTWTWVNGETFTFQQWATSRPSTTPGNTLDHVEVSGGGGAEIGKWYDRSPTTIRDGYIMETGYATDPLVADADGDGLNDGAEQAAGSNPFLADTDGDGLTDSQEVNLTHTNPNLADSNGNGTNDAQEDPDGDGLTNLAEVTQYGTNPLLADSDTDGLNDGAEINHAGSFYQLVPGSFTYPQALADAAAKHGRVAGFPNAADYSRLAAKARQTTQGYLWIGLSDAATEGTWLWSNGSAATYSRWLAGEPSGGTSENHVVIMENSTQWADTTENFLAAGYLFERVGLDPLDPDTDADGLTDGQEVSATHTNPVLDDTDGDGLLDGAEVNTHHSDPLLVDTDADGLNDREEVEVYHSNPSLKDSDGDGFDDLFEVNTGFDPALASSTPDALSTIRTAVEFRFNAASGVSYRIEASTDLTAWTTIEPVIIGESAVVTRFYSTENQPQRYFRVRRN